MRRWIWLALGAVCGCTDPGGDETPSVHFPTDLVEAGYVQTRGCRSPGEHSAIGGFTVWVNPESAQAFQALFDGQTDVLPAGTIVVKQTHAGPDCAPADVVAWLAMKKEPGFAPQGGDWHWQELSADGTLSADGPDEGCRGCHAGTDDTTCRGFGAVNGYDYVCTQP